VLLLEEQHHLAAGEVADAGDERRGARLLGEAVARHVVELGRAVHREAPRARPVARLASEERRQQGDVAGDVGEVRVHVRRAAAAQAVPQEHGLAEVEALPQRAARAGRGEAEGLLEGRFVPSGVADERAQMGAEQVRDAHRQQRVRRACLGLVGAREDLVRLCAPDRERVDRHALLAQSGDLSLDERVRHGRVPAGEVGDPHQRGSPPAGGRAERNAPPPPRVRPSRGDPGGLVTTVTTPDLC
jgi:hypothetical protein